MTLRFLDITARLLACGRAVWQGKSLNYESEKKQGGGKKNLIFAIRYSPHFHQNSVQGRVFYFKIRGKNN